MATEPRCGFTAQKGYLHKESGACCAATCGACDDSAACGTRPGGADACCASSLRYFGAPCSSHNPPPCTLHHLLVPATPKPAPLCADGGIAANGTQVCCAASCGVCDSDNCAARSGGRVMCCPATIAQLDVECTKLNTPPCVRKQ